jgi:hypothetical protein
MLYFELRLNFYFPLIKYGHEQFVEAIRFMCFIFLSVHGTLTRRGYLVLLKAMRI